MLEREKQEIMRSIDFIETGRAWQGLQVLCDLVGIEAAMLGLDEEDYDPDTEPEDDTEPDGPYTA